MIYNTLYIRQENLHMTAQTFEFTAKIDKLLDNVARRNYATDDMFLRELISNASDAIEKLKSHVLENNIEDAEYKISISFDRDNKNLIISDTGIGMTFEEMRDNLGIIAKSGTEEYLKSASGEKTSNDNMIGSFGIGFYSATLAGDKVTVYSKSIYSDRPYKWESQLTESFTISELGEEDHFDQVRGTKIVIHIKPEKEDYLTEKKIKEIILKNSQSISNPIYVQTKKTRQIEDSEDPEKKVDEEYYDYEYVNSNGPYWRRKPSECSEDGYKSFFKTIPGCENDTSIDTLHFRVEGEVEFTALLYIRNPIMFDERQRKTGITLYKNSVVIAENYEEIIPDHFKGIIKGAVECNQIVLNISREVAQHTKEIKMIKKHLGNKIIRHLQTMMKSEPEKYKKFYDAYRKELKVGIHNMESGRENLASLLQFYSLSSQDKMISLDTYLSDKKDDQKDIFYIAGENMKIIADSPLITGYKNKGIDVIFCTDCADVYSFSSLDKYKDHKIVDVIKKQSSKDTSSEQNEICKQFKKVLGTRVESVVISDREFEQAAVVSIGEGGINPLMEKVMNTQPLGSDQMKMFMRCTKTLELNPSHPLVKHIVEHKDDEKTIEKIENLFCSACLTCGFEVYDPVILGKRLERLACFDAGIVMDYHSESLAHVEEEENGDADFDMPNLEDNPDPQYNNDEYDFSGSGNCCEDESCSKNGECDKNQVDISTEETRETTTEETTSSDKEE